LKEFKIKNMCVIRDEAIKHYVDNLTSILKINIINDLLYDYKYSINNIKINDNFPSYALLKAFSHLIIDYYIANYSLNPLLRNKSKEKILVFLKKFNRLNPLFGRKIIVIKKKNQFQTLSSKYKYDGKNYYYFVENFITQIHKRIIVRKYNKYNKYDKYNKYNKYNKYKNQIKRFNYKKFNNKQNIIVNNSSELNNINLNNLIVNNNSELNNINELINDLLNDLINEIII
jgi:hypothetical protein